MTETPDPDEPFRPQTLPEQLAEIWIKVSPRLVGFFGKSRVFWLTVFGWAVGMIALHGFQLFASGLFFPSWFAGIGSQLQIYCYGISNQWTAVGGFQILVWWQCRWPTRPRVIQLIGLILFHMMLSQYLIMFFFNDAFMSSYVWVALSGVGSCFLLFGLWLVIIRSLQTVFWFRLVPRDIEDTNSTNGLAVSSLQAWSLRGLFSTTLLIAGLIAGNRLMVFLYQQLGNFDLPNYEGFILASQISTAVSGIALMISVVYARLTRRYWVLLLPCLLSISIQQMSVLLYDALGLNTSGTSFYASNLIETFCFLAIGIGLHWFCFSLWDRAGYDLIGWMRGQGRLNESIDS